MGDELGQLAVGMLPGVAGRVVRRRGEQAVGAGFPPMRLPFEVGAMAGGAVGGIHHPAARDLRRHVAGPAAGVESVGGAEPDEDGGHAEECGGAVNWLGFRGRQEGRRRR